VSNFLAVATVTEALRQLLQAEVSDDVPGATVTMVRPETDGNGNQAPRVNVYLYRVTPNAALRNNDLPNRDGDGRLRNRPVSALDLHYLFSFYGNETQLEPQRLLGSAVRTLHTYPVITRDMIDDVLGSTAFGFLASSTLGDQPELVKFTPSQLSLDDLSKLWSVFFQTPYALSVSYEATVVLIESEETAMPSLPVQRRNLRVLPFRQPRIEQVRDANDATAPIQVGSTLLIKGQQLQGDVTQLRFSGNVIVAPQTVSDTEITVTLASPPFPANTLRAGVQGVQVVQQVLFGTTADPHPGFESNVAPFVLHPTITTLSVNAAGDQVTVNVNPPLRARQRATLLLNARVGSPPAAHAFPLPPVTANTPSPVFAVTGVATGDYFARVQVDGAESPIDLDPASPTFGPIVTFP
jgi:Pvc16 N-terminal domain